MNAHLISEVQSSTDELQKNALHTLCEYFCLWRPLFSDLEDNMLLELGVKAKCSRIVTYNLQDFRGVESFGLKAVKLLQLFKTIGVIG